MTTDTDDGAAPAGRTAYAERARPPWYARAYDGWHSFQDRRAAKREAIAMRRAAERDPPHVTVPAWLVKGVGFAGNVAYAGLMYFLWERVLQVSQAQHAALEVTHAGIWSNLDLAIFFPLIIGYVFVVVTVPYVAKICIPMLVELSWRENFWPKLVALGMTFMVSTVLITGTASVGANALMESERDSAVAVEQVERGMAAAQADIDTAERELRDMMNHSNTYMALAASVGEAEWQRSYIDVTPRSDWQYDRMVRALGAARAADAKRAEIREMRSALAGSQTTASVSASVVTDRTRGVNAVMGFLNTYWILMLAAVMDAACLFCPWLRMRLEQKRNRQLGLADRAGGVLDDDHLIEDMRDEPEPETKKMYEPSRRVVNADTGEEEIEVKAHWRKLRKGKRHAVPTGPVVLPDEVQAVSPSDERERQSDAQTISQEGPQEREQGDAQGAEQAGEGEAAGEDEALSDEELIALELESASADEPEPSGDAGSHDLDPGVKQLPDGEGVMQIEDQRTGTEG